MAIFSICTIAIPLLGVIISYTWYSDSQSSYIAMVVDKSDQVKEQILIQAESIHHHLLDTKRMITRGQMMYSCSLEDMANPNTILVMNMEMKDCDKALHDQQFLSKVARSQLRGIIILDNMQGVNRRVSSPYHLWARWIPDVAVGDKQVVVVKMDHWLKIKEHLIKKGKTVSLGVGKERLNKEDIDLKCDYSGEVSINDDTPGVVFGHDGNFSQIIKLFKQLVPPYNETNVEIPITILTTCNLTNQENPSFIDNGNTLSLNQFSLRDTRILASSCCLSKFNILKIFGAGCPDKSLQTLQQMSHCSFSPFIEGKCNNVHKLQTHSRYCKIKNSSCVIQEYFNSPCKNYNKMDVCDMATERCS